MVIVQFFFLLQLPQCALKFSVAVALDLVPLVDFLKQTVHVMRTAIEEETVVMMYKQHVHEVRILTYPQERARTLYMHGNQKGSRVSPIQPSQY